MKSCTSSLPGVPGTPRGGVPLEGGAGPFYDFFFAASKCFRFPALAAGDVAWAFIFPSE